MTTGFYDAMSYVGGPLVTMRDDTVTDSLPHNFDPNTAFCRNCSRGYQEILDDCEPCYGMMPRSATIDYMAIIHDLAAGS